MKEFVLPEFEKLAMLIVTRDLMKEQFRNEIDPNRQESFSQRDL